MSLLSLLARPRWLRPAAIEGDPFFEDVLLLLHMNGTALVDSSRFARAFGVGFGSQVSLSSEHRKFGDASLKTVAVFNNVSLIITDPSTDFALADDDFTIEAWVRPTTISGRNGICDFGPSGDFSLEISETSKFKAFLWSGSAFATVTGTTTVATNAWYHVAVTRSGTTLKLWVNGVEEASAGSATGPPSSSYGVRIGATAAGQFVGFTDEFRITRQARYSETFSVPVKSFQDR